MSKSPSFQLYVQDFLVGTMHMTAEQVGSYMLLLLYQWDKGSVPNAMEKLAGIGRCSVECIEKIIDKFPKSEDGKLRNKRMEAIREEQAANRARKSKAGIEGNEKRWGKKEIPKVKTEELSLLINWFRIGNVLYRLPVSEFIKMHMPEFLNIWTKQNKEIPIETILNEMDKNCCGKDFTDEAHIQNTLRKTARELKPVKAYNKVVTEKTTASTPKPFPTEQ